MPVFNVQKASAAGWKPEQIQSYLASRPDLTPSDAIQAPAQQGGGLSDWLPTAGAVLGGVVGSGAGPVGSIGGSALGGAGGEWLRQLLQGQKTDIGSIAKEGAIGGVGGAVGEVAGPVFKAAKSLVGGGAKAATEVAGQTAAKAATDTGGNVLEKLGNSLRKGVTNPKVNPSATAFGDEAALMQGAKEAGLSGPAELQRAQSNIEYKRLVGEMQNKLAVNNPPLDPKTTKSAVQQAIEGTLNYDASSPAWKRALNLRTNQIGDLGNVQELLKYKLDLGNKLGRAFKKIDVGQDLTTQEEAALATWQSVDRIITGAAPELKDLTTQMSILHKLAPGLKSAANKTSQVEILGTKIPLSTPLMQGVQDAAGQTLQSIGGSNVLKAGVNGVKNVAGKTAAQVGTKGVLDTLQPKQAEAAVPQGPTTDFGSGSSDTTGPLSDFTGEPISKSGKIKQAFAAAMLANPKQAATLKTIYDFGFADQGAGANVGKVTAKDYATAKAGLQNIQDVRKLFKSDPNVLVKQLVPGKLFSRQFDSAMYDTADALLRLRTGAQANPDEIRGYMRTIAPSIGDSSEDVKYKLDKLEKDLKVYTTGGSGDFSSAPDASTIDQFAQ